jgi:hypothetical protein
MTSGDLYRVSIVFQSIRVTRPSADVFARLKRIECAIPTAVEIEDRHVKNKPAIVHLPAPLKFLSPIPRGIYPRSSHFQVHLFDSVFGD